MNRNIGFTNISDAATDFGNVVHKTPLGVLHPAFVDDIAETLELVSIMGPITRIKVAAAGYQHCVRGQAQVDKGIIISMRSSLLYETRVFPGENPPYVDVYGGESWINLLNETLKYGLAPKSWTDYLHLTIGGTLSNSGISEQAFSPWPPNQFGIREWGPLQCSSGRAGQFGIISKARIILEPAPHKVKLIRALYSNFTKFSQDQELLITSQKTFDYIEGMVVKNSSDEAPLFRLEVTKNFNNSDDPKVVKAEIDRLSSNLSYTPSTLTITESTYVEFLERVYTAELFLRSIGLWEGGAVAHPWLELLVPKSKIQIFASQVFYNIVTDTNTGPILVYPFNKAKWDNKTSLVFPDEDIFYLTSFLPRANLSSNGTDGLDFMFKQRQKILDFCESAGIGEKQYFPFYETPEEYKSKHYSEEQWKLLSQRKLMYDTSCTLAPGHNIFTFETCPGLTGLDW
ncbi:hypothetical protein DM860_004319 [Cuscuta australis]|uniref:Cytokinin dehydrogenase 1 FAD/cytokinin binding domain-containing protein n=1 Tax=Cuscuta australis TaxID=267555 RepID=A0A328EB06_9ASTE|nr:hypothetical protein DM860_004319 [Cuscuta australis]